MRKDKRHRSARKRKNYQKRQKIKLEQMTRIKMDMPTTYDGMPELFERWTYAVNTWFEITCFPKRYRVKQMLSFMKGRAEQYFITFVAQT